MSALLTHAAVGLLLGVALRLPVRYLPLAAFLAAAPDLDHLDDFGGLTFVESRVTFHNFAFLVALPLAVYAILVWRKARPEWRQVAAAAPVIMLSHVLLDILPIDPLGGGGWAALFYPFSDTIYTIPYFGIRPMDPTTFSTFTILFVLLSALILLAVGSHWLEHRETERKGRRRGLLVAGAYAAVWLVLVSGFASAGTFIERPSFPNANLSLADPEARWPEGRLTAVVRNFGGYPAGVRTLQLEVVANGQVIASGRNPTAVAPGDAWLADLALPVDARGQKLEARLVGINGTHVYATKAVGVVKGHVEAQLEVAGLQVSGASWILTIRNPTDLPVPAGAMKLTVTASGGQKVHDGPNPALLSPGGEWRLTLRPPPAALLNAATIAAVSVDDGYVHLQETRTPSAAPPLGGIPPSGALL